MSLKSSLDLISNADWSIHKNQIVKYGIIYRTNSHCMLAHLFSPGNDTANHVYFFAYELHSKPHPFSVFCDNQRHLRTFRLLSKVKNNV
jgi:hypothetical protein